MEMNKNNRNKKIYTDFKDVPIKYNEKDSSRLYPNWHDIEKMRLKKEKGEIELLKYLDKNLEKEWEIYYQPHMNGEHPDIILLNPHYGLTVIEVKDWERTSYRKDPRNHKHYVYNNERRIYVPDIARQVNRYYYNILNYYLPSFEHSDKAIKRAVYLSKMTTQKAVEFIEPKNNLIVFGFDFLKSSNNYKILINSERGIFSEDKADEIRSWLRPTKNFERQLNPINLDTRQREISKSQPNKRMRVKGSVGTGKTLVLADRAMNIVNEGKTVLIVSYNITLWHYIRDLAARNNAGGKNETRKIVFTHFHKLCYDIINKNYIKIDKKRIGEEDYYKEYIPNLTRKVIDMQRAEYLRFDAILIDEGQDFQQNWFDLLMLMLTINNEVLLVADKMQNIYKRDLEWIDKTMSGFIGRWGELNNNYRLPPKIRNAVIKFNKNFLKSDLTLLSSQQSELFGEIMWVNLDKNTYENEIILNTVNYIIKEHKQHPEDIAILLLDHKRGAKIKKYLENENFNITDVFKDDIESDKARKNAFFMQTGCIKMSTHHSFKGWEIENLIIIIDDMLVDDNKMDMITYTSISRSRNNLYVMNYNKRYNEFGNEITDDKRKFNSYIGLNNLNL